MCPPISQVNEFITHFEKIRTKQPNRTSAVVVLPRLKTPGTDYKVVISRYKKIYTYTKGTYLFNTYTSTLEQESANPIQVPYDVFLADNLVKTSLSVHKSEKDIPNK